MKILKPIILKESAAPSTPPTGHVALYSVDGTALLMKDDAGVVTSLGGAPAGTKISAMTAATVPLDGTETVPIIQGGANRKATVADLRMWDITKVLSSNATNSSTTAASVTGLEASLAPGTWLVKTWMLLQSAATTTGMAIHWNASGGTVSAIAMTWYSLTTGTTATTGVMDQASAAATFQTMEGRAQRANNTSGGPFGGVDTANADQFAVCEGIVVVTATTTLQHMLASEVASSQVMMKAGTTATFGRVA